MSEPKDNRIPIMMSDAEVKAIDDWRFENRVSTRSEAIRRLCQMGLELDRTVTPLMREVTGAVSNFLKFQQAHYPNGEVFAAKTLEEQREHLDIYISASEHTERLLGLITQLGGFRAIYSADHGDNDLPDPEWVREVASKAIQDLIQQGRDRARSKGATKERSSD